MRLKESVKLSIKLMERNALDPKKEIVKPEWQLNPWQYYPEWNKERAQKYGRLAFI